MILYPNGPYPSSSDYATENEVCEWCGGFFFPDEMAKDGEFCIYCKPSKEEDTDD